MTAVDQEVLLAALVVMVVVVVVVHEVHHSNKVTTHILRKRSVIRQGHERNRRLLPVPLRCVVATESLVLNFPSYLLRPHSNEIQSAKDGLLLLMEEIHGRLDKN